MDTIKKTLLLLSLCFSAQLLNAQDIDVFNQAEMVNKYAVEGSFKLSTGYPTGSGIANHKYTVEVKEFERSGLNGEPLKYLKFTCVSGELGDFTLVPDNPWYPLFYKALPPTNGKLSRFWQEFSSYAYGGGRKLYMMMNSGLVVPVEWNKIISMGQHAASMQNFSIDHYQFLSFKLTRKEWYGKYNRKHKLYYIHSSPSSSPYKDFIDFAKKEDFDSIEYPGVAPFFKKKKEYQSQRISEVKKKSYDMLMREALDGIEDKTAYVYYTKQLSGHTSQKSKNFGIIKMVPKLNGDKLTSIVYHHPFDDGKFYDKDKFKSNPTSKSSNGYLIYDRSENGAYGDMDDIELIPFDGRIIGISRGTSGSSLTITHVFTKYENDFLAESLINNRLTDMNKTSKAFWMADELESTYDPRKDTYLFFGFFSNYIKALDEANGN